MNSDEALYWFQEGFHAGAVAERGRLREAEAARRRAAVNRDLQQVIGVLAVALLDSAHTTCRDAALRRERAKREL